MTPSAFAAILEDRLKFIDDAVSRIENGEGGRPELDSLRGYLIDIWEIIERNPGIEAAVDDLYEVAARAVSGSAAERQPQFRARRIIREAALRLRERLVAARPLLSRFG